MKNRSAVDKTVKALRALGRVEDIDASVIVAAQTLADAVDEEPHSAALWQQYQRALETLRGIGANVSTDSFDKLLAELRTPVGDSSYSEEKDTRSSRRKDR